MNQTDTALWRALQPLRSVAGWLMTGAHPDDEWNGFLGWLALGRGVRTMFACTTRGEGGQNAVGPERGRALGALRSREMECAAAEIGLAVRWLGAGPGNGMDDPMFDFGFSKSGEDTLRRWGEARLMDRLVRLIRTERPDAVSPTFLDVPGQHGHHRAVTRCTLRAVAAAADPAIDAGGTAPWRVAKTYLPAFSGAGGSYDDREPPPAETVRVDLGARCALGISWAQLGERSRRFHASQGMGRDLPDGPRPFPLHLAAGVPDAALPMDGLPHSLAELAGTLPDGPAGRGLRAAGEAIDEALAAFPDGARAAQALRHASRALDGLEVPEEMAHRIARKRRQLAHATALALGFGGTIALTPDTPRAGSPVAVRLEPASAMPRLPRGWAGGVVPADAAPLDTLRDGFDPLGGNDPLGAVLEGDAARLELDPPERLAVAPAADVRLTPARVVRRLGSTTPVVLTLEGAAPPAGWPVLAAEGTRVTLDTRPGRTDLPPAGARLLRIATPHVGRVALLEPAVASVLRAPIAIDPGARVGVVAGEADETLGWLRQMDIEAEALDDDALAGDLGRFTTILVGIFGFGQRPALRAARARLMAWIEAGGSLVTLYHRPGDGWDEGRTPPLPIVVGSPSFNWRVTDPAAPVRVLVPDHPVLAGPNRIGPEDWQGWVRERGLYFARSWDPRYTPLVELADPGDTPHRGALLAAPVGAGRHVHVALALHHQVSALVPGAFRLLANLVARPG